MKRYALVGVAVGLLLTFGVAFAQAIKVEGPGASDSSPVFATGTNIAGCTFTDTSGGQITCPGGHITTRQAFANLAMDHGGIVGIRVHSDGIGLAFLTTNGATQWYINGADGDLKSDLARNINTTGMGIFKGAGGGLRVGPAGGNVLDIAAGASTAAWSAYSSYTGDSSIVQTPRAQTVASDGAGTAAAFNIDIGNAGGINVTIDCQDANGCNATMLETNVGNGTYTCFTNISANAVNFADTAGVSETAGAFAAGQYDSICMQYIVDRWVERSRSNN